LEKSLQNCLQVVVERRIATVIGGTMDKICDLLEYIGLSEDDLETVYYKIHFWSFVVSLADQLEESGTLSPKQKKTLVDLVLKHTGAVCDTTVLTHETRYERNGKKNNKAGVRVKHNFRNLKDIQLYDLPYKSGSTQSLEFHPYNLHTTVVKIKDKFYRIPLPSKWPKLKKVTTVTFTYKRTEFKGYMNIPLL
jgi:hypothetical protein